MYFDVNTKKFREEEKNADKIAFVASDKTLTWKELKVLSDAILTELEVRKEDTGKPVLLYDDKSAFCLAKILSCYRKNVPFVPIDLSWPQKRINSIADQINNLKSATIGEDVAYIIFTSGSTGAPKGVVLSNDNLSAFISRFMNEFSLSENTVFINRAAFSFDISLADLFGALQSGGTAIFNTHEIVKKGSFFERIRTFKGSHWNSTPSFISTLLPDKNFSTQNLPSIKTFVLSGEDLSPALVKELKNRFPSATVINAYGPTETCIFASQVEITGNMLDEPSLPISKFPSQNMTLENEEIIITGPQVGKGYLNEVPFSGGNYYTGDLGYEKNGYLYYKGRKDEQVKFNGYRIELNEIKTNLERLEGIVAAQCIPLLINGKIARLLAFVKTSSPIRPENLKTQLAETLPPYMMPSEIIRVPEFPLTSSQKVDKKKLLSTYLATN